MDNLTTSKGSILFYMGYAQWQNRKLWNE